MCESTDIRCCMKIRTKKPNYNPCVRRAEYDPSWVGYPETEE